MLGKNIFTAVLSPPRQIQLSQSKSFPTQWERSMSQHGYTHPLSVFSFWVGGVLQRVDVNDISHQQELSWISRSGTITDRYWVYPVYDPFGNVINNIGGEYLIRRADDVYAAPGYEASTPIHVSCQLEFAARSVPYTQAVAYSDRFRVASILSQAGLYNGHYHQPAEVNLTSAGAIANSSITLQRQTSDAIQQQGNGWTLQRDAYQGNYGTKYATSAYVALEGYQQLTQHQALYPEFEGRGFSSVFHLEPNASLLVTFSRKPQLKEAGFWILTAYGANQYLIANVLDRYVVSDRTSSLTFQDSGKMVYGPDADEQEDGAFEILLQPADLPPPKNWTSNWLPVESSKG
ncbi:unnamed protein product [Zymoseptoria tritici ST99CH_1E4]|uniref:DUF1214 domain-containing protein n=1 Tax=Zymoseptoria tritici ST99CH_1E4 TaxID=1276532 RepID=A0A2H1GI10_ZYMTR|nr:unnamed protein product [Zymoseptoria tritici ST99CH_1E4]